MIKVLITGGCGFIGTNLIKYILDNKPDWQVTNLDLLTYAGNLENTHGLTKDYPSRYFFVKGDIAETGFVDDLFATEQVRPGAESCCREPCGQEYRRGRGIR